MGAGASILYGRKVHLVELEQGVHQVVQVAHVACGKGWKLRG